MHGRPDPAAIAEADAQWVTMHGPEIQMRRQRGDDIAVAALAALGEGPAVSACGGGGQLTEAQADAALARAPGP